MSGSSFSIGADEGIARALNIKKTRSYHHQRQLPRSRPVSESMDGGAVDHRDADHCASGDLREYRLAQQVAGIVGRCLPHLIQIGPSAKHPGMAGFDDRHRRPFGYILDGSPKFAQMRAVVGVRLLGSVEHDSPNPIGDF